MNRVTGIGGIFLKSSDPKALMAWYKQHLGVPAEAWGAIFHWPREDRPNDKGCTIWCPFAANTTYFAPSEKPYMLNFTVENLERLLQTLKEEGIEPLAEMQSSEQGKFCWIMDPEGTKIELWEPAPDEAE